MKHTSSKGGGDVIPFAEAQRKRDDMRDFTARKLALVDAVMVDPSIGHLDFRVFWYVASTCDRATGVSGRTQSRIAVELSVTRRAVQNCVHRLAASRYLSIVSKPGGKLATGYRLDFCRVPFRPEGGLPVDHSSENHRSHSGSPSANGGSHFNPSTGNEGSHLVRTTVPSSVNDGSHNWERPFAQDPFTIPDSLPSRARAPSADEPLGAGGAELQRLIGTAAYVSWLSKFQLGEVSDLVVELIAPSKWLADAVRDRFDDKILEAWRSQTPSIERVSIVVAPKSDR